MIPRISTVLAQFISPIATSGKEFKRDERGKKPPEPPSIAVPPKDEPKDEAKDDAQPEAVLPQSIPAGIPAGINYALFQLMALLRDQRISVMRWLGTNAYQISARTQKKNGRSRKGAILDQKAS